MPRDVEAESGEPNLEWDPNAVTRLFQILDTAPIEWSIPDGDLAIRFVTAEECCELHQDFFDDPDLTDVMTFPGDPEDTHAGDLAVCPAYAATAITEHGTTFAEELTLYLVHGWLHLAGLDDRTDASRAEMRRAEAIVLQPLLEAGAIPEFRWTREPTCSP